MRIQLLLFSSATLASLGLTQAAIGPSQCCDLQLRLTVEYPAKDFRLSPGSIRPSSNARRNMALRREGVRGCNAGTAFDSLLAKILVRGREAGEAAQRAVRLGRETSVGNQGQGGRSDHE